jgi:hypothetical protein
VADAETTETDISTRGAQAALIESFGITGLYGYRSISLSSEYAATILIAKNGSGKTTLLGALDAFLRSQFSRLRDLQFSEIRCKLKGIKSELVLTREDVIYFIDLQIQSEFAAFARKNEIEPAALFHYLIEEYEDHKNDRRALREDAVFSVIRRSLGFDYLEASSKCDELRESLLNKMPRIKKINTAIRAALRGIEVVYLPTYRRIELPIPDKLKSIASVRLERIIAAPIAPDCVIRYKTKPKSEDLQKLNAEFDALDSCARYRGKFAIQFFLKWLDHLAEDYAKPETKLFGEFDRKAKVRRSEIALGNLASKSPIPMGLKEFISALVPLAVG